MMELTQEPSPNLSGDATDIIKANKRKRVEEEDEGKWDDWNGHEAK